MARGDDKLIESYAGLAEAMNRMNAEAPELFKLYQEARQVIQREQTAAQAAREEAKKLNKTLKQKIAEADKLKAEYQARRADLEKLCKEAEEQVKLWKEKIQEAEDARQRILNSEPLLNYRLDELARSFDYNESNTVTALYQKYRDVGPLIVRRPNWTADQGYLVLSVTGTQVQGVAFKDGKPAVGGSVPRANSLCKIFAGPSQRDIFRYALRQQ